MAPSLVITPDLRVRLGFVGRVQRVSTSDEFPDEGIQGVPVNDQRSRERHAEADLDPIRKGQRLNPNWEGGRNVHLYDVAHSPSQPSRGGFVSYRRSR